MAVLLNQAITSPALIGRIHELQALQQFIDQAKMGQGQTVLIAGEAGVGKSRLLAEAKAYAASQGFSSFPVSCYQTDAALPYAPLFEPLRSYTSANDTRIASEQLSTIVDELRRLLPELTLLPSTPTSLPLDTEQKRYRLLTVLSSFFTYFASQQPLMLVIEDVHWSDESTLGFLHHFIRRCLTHPIIVLVSYRSDEVNLEVKQWLAQLDREHLVHELMLERLSLDESETMLRLIFELNRPIHSEFMSILYTLTEGNPFFIEEVLKSLLVSGVIDLKEGAWDRKPIGTFNIPRTVQTAVQQRLVQLTREARQLVQLAAVMGRQFDFNVLQRLTQHADIQLFAFMKELISAQLIVEESAERFVFRHALTRQALYNSLLARERQLLHQAVGEAIENVYAPSLERYSSNLAYHFYEAGDWERVLNYSVQAGEYAQSLYALHPAVEHFTRAIETAQRLGRLAPLTLLRARGLAYEMLGEFKFALADLETVLRESEVQQDRQGEWQALLDLGLIWSGQDYIQAGQYYQRAFELARQLQVPLALAHSLNRLGNWHLNVEHPLEGHWHHQEALTIFEGLGDQKAIADTLDLLGMASYLGGNLVQGTRYYEKAVEQFYVLNQRHGLISSLTTMTMRAPTYQTDTLIPAVETLAEAIGEGEMALKIARETGHRSGETYVMIMLGILIGSQGHYQRALNLLQEAVALAQDIQHQQWIAAAQVAIGGLYLEAFALQDAEGTLKQAMEVAKKVQSLHWLRNAVGFLASTYVQQGRLEDADALLREHLDTRQPVRTLGQRLMWRACIELALARGDGTAALQFTDQLLASTMNFSSATVIARLAKLRGEALWLMGRNDEAEIEFTKAQTTAVHQGAKLLLWRIDASLARLFQEQSRFAEAQQHTTDALSLIEDLASQLPEMLRVAFHRHASSAVSNSGLSTEQPESSKTRRSALTSREREIATLLALGKTNRQMAEQLVLSERTIETHVSNILSKLDLASRTQVAVWAVETGLIIIHPSGSHQDA